MARLAGKMALLAVPFSLLLAVELFLPIDFFTFRAWEALAVSENKVTRFFLPGPFYPDMKIARVEEGDLGHHTRYAVKKPVRWETDAFGYRKKSGRGASCKVVILGDSTVAGTGLTQEAILSEALGSRLGIDVYPLAPANINTLLFDRRFSDDSTDIVVLVSIERDLVNLPLPKTRTIRFKPSIENKTVRGVAISLDRITKMNMYHFIRARRDPTPPHLYGGMLFLQGDAANNDIPEEEHDKILRTLIRYNELLADRKKRFIFLPVPNKENIHHDRLPSKRKPGSLTRLVGDLQKRGVEAIDLQGPFEEAKGKGLLLYQMDDTHWDEDGVNLAANLLARKIAGAMK